MFQLGSENLSHRSSTIVPHRQPPVRPLLLYVLPTLVIKRIGPTTLERVYPIACQRTSRSHSGATYTLLRDSSELDAWINHRSPLQDHTGPRRRSIGKKSKERAFFTISSHIPRRRQSFPLCFWLIVPKIRRSPHICLCLGLNEYVSSMVTLATISMPNPDLAPSLPLRQSCNTSGERDPP